MKVPSDDDLQELAGRVAEALLRVRGRMATAESCTGGWIAKVCTDVAGCSDWFNGSLVTYNNTAKEQLAGVSAELLKLHGAVSEPVVLAMAEGASRALDAQWAVAVSGIAGPTGGTVSKPVGTVWVAWGCAGDMQAERHIFIGDRDTVRRHSVGVALEGLLQRLQKD
ncbi:MAG: CinA family protein [Natronospirillum sp.]